MSSASLETGGFFLISERGWLGRWELEHREKPLTPSLATD